MNQIDIRNVRYRLIVYPQEGMPIDITSLCQRIQHEEREQSFTASLSFYMKNVKEPDHGWMHNHVRILTRVVLQSSEDSHKWQTIFNGLIYRRKTIAETHAIDIQAYDLLYPLMQSEEHYYFRDKMTGKAAIETIAKDKGIKLLPIKGFSEPLGKEVATGTIARTIEERIESHNKKSSTKVMARATHNGELEIFNVGTNDTIYEVTDWSVEASHDELDAEDMVTVVKIYQKSDKDDRPSVKSIHKRNTEYGSIQKILTDSDDAAKEAKEILDEKSKPKRKAQIKTVDIPWVRKGDKLRVASGTIGSYKDGKQVPLSYIVKSVSRSIDNRSMTVELEV